jgi:hypothetical protein
LEGSFVRNKRHDKLSIIFDSAAATSRSYRAFAALAAAKVLQQTSVVQSGGKRRAGMCGFLGREQMFHNGVTSALGFLTFTQCGERPER